MPPGVKEPRKGKTGLPIPTNIDVDPEKAQRNPNDQQCVDCGYVYNEAEGEFHPPSECPARVSNPIKQQMLMKKLFPGG